MVTLILLLLQLPHLLVLHAVADVEVMRDIVKTIVMDVDMVEHVTVEEEDDSQYLIF
jgi:hypothetical protein